MSEPPKWLKKIAYQAALFGATQKAFSESEDGVELELKKTLLDAKQWYPATLSTFSTIYHDALRRDKELDREESQCF